MQDESPVGAASNDGAEPNGAVPGGNGSRGDNGGARHAEASDSPQRKGSDSASHAAALKDFLTSESAAELAEIITAYLLKVKETEAASRERAAATYHRSTIWRSATFVTSLTVCLGAILIVVWMLKDTKDLLLPSLSAIISLIAGAGGGFVFGRRSSQPSD